MKLDSKHLIATFILGPRIWSQTLDSWTLGSRPGRLVPDTWFLDAWFQTLGSRHLVPDTWFQTRWHDLHQQSRVNRTLALSTTHRTLTVRANIFGSRHLVPGRLVPDTWFQTFGSRHAGMIYTNNLESTEH